jgi:hypothetical protein
VIVIDVTVTCDSDSDSDSETCDSDSGNDRVCGSDSGRVCDKLVYTYISGWQDGARKGGCSLLPVGARESGSWSFLQVGA